MTQEHPVTPPDELVRQWATTNGTAYKDLFALCQSVADQAAQWARAELAEPADGEVAELVAWMRNQATVHEMAQTQWAKRFVRAASLLESLSPPQPISVTERLPGPEDCDAEGRCWLGGEQFAPGDPTWVLGFAVWAKRFPEIHRYWLPAHALPVPEEVV